MKKFSIAITSLFTMVPTPPLRAVPESPDPRNWHTKNLGRLSGLNFMRTLRHVALSVLGICKVYYAGEFRTAGLRKPEAWKFPGPA